MANGIRIGDPRGFNKERSSKFCEGSRVRQTHEEGRKIYRPKRGGNNNKDEDNSLKTLNDKQTASLQRIKTASLQRKNTRDIKLSDGEALVMLELWRMQSITTLPSLPGPLWFGVVTPDKVLFMVK